MRIGKLVGGAAALLALVHLGAATAAAGIAEITGTVNWDRATRIPPGTLATVRLLDVGRGDAVRELAAIAVLPGEEPPLRFRLFYDAALVDPDGAYRLTAEMRVGELRLMESLRATPVLTTGGTAEPEILLERVVLAREAGRSPVGRTWVAVAILGAPVAPATRVTLHLGEDGVATGSTGCNDFRAGYAASPQVLELGPFATTKRGCPTPIMQGEKAAVRAFREVRGWRLNAGALILTDAAGGEMIRLEAGR